MAKNNVRDWDATPANNTDVGGINIQGSAPPSNMDDALREIMSQFADVNEGTSAVDDTWTFCDPADPTKKIRFDAGSLSTATTRVMTFPNTNITWSSFGASLVDDADAAAARTTLGLGSLATASSISNSNWSGTDLSVANGGTGASDAATARANLGLAIGSNVQAYDAGLQAIAGLAVTNSNFIVGNGSTWVVESGATARASLGLGSAATVNTGTSGAAVPLLNGTNVWSGNQTIQNSAPALFLKDTTSGSYDFQLSFNSNNVYFQGSPDGTTYSVKIQFEMDTNNVYFGRSGGTSLIWNGSYIPVNVGGTGSTTAAGARSNLGLGALATRDLTDIFGNWDEVSRTSGTRYQNTTGRFKAISIKNNNNGGQIYTSSSSAMTTSNYMGANAASRGDNAFLIVPPNWYYIVVCDRNLAWETL